MCMYMLKYRKKIKRKILGHEKSENVARYRQYDIGRIAAIIHHTSNLITSHVIDIII